MLGIEVSVGGARGLLHEAETSVRCVAIVRLMADPAYRAVYAAQAAGGAKVSAAAQTKARARGRPRRADEPALAVDTSLRRSETV